MLLGITPVGVKNKNLEYRLFELGKIYFV